MKLIIKIFSIIVMILLSSCKDNTTSPQPTKTGFSVKITVKNSSGTPVAGLRINAWNHFPSSFLLGRQATHNVSSSIQSLHSVQAASSINFSTASIARINLSVFEFDGTPVSTLIDDIRPAGRYSVQWNNQAHKPPRVYYYRLIAQDTATAVPLFRDSLFAVLWHLGDLAFLGWSSSGGTFETSDKLLFPNVLDLPTLIRTSPMGPDSLSTFVIPDTVTIALTDTVTNRQIEFDQVIKKGVANDIQLVWSPALSKQCVPYQLPMESEHSCPVISTLTQDFIATIRTNQQTEVLFDWKLVQNYPNPFN